jgi:hypothetical protein
VDSDQLETEFFVSEGKVEITSPQAGLLLDVPLDARLYFRSNPVGWGFV